MNIYFKVGDAVQIFTVDGKAWYGQVENIDNNIIKLYSIPVLPPRYDIYLKEIKDYFYISIDKITTYRILSWK